MKLAVRLNLYLWYIVVGTAIDLAHTWQPITIDWAWLHHSNPSWFHIGFFFVVTPLFAAWVVGLFKQFSWRGFFEVAAFVVFFSIAEDWLYIFTTSLVLREWQFPWHYTWMNHAYWPWVYQSLGQNWWLDWPTGYWIGFVLCGLLLIPVFKEAHK